MSCLCGSSKCDCEEECYCFEAVCRCSICSLLPKMCPTCDLPCYTTDYACQICTCHKQGEDSESEKSPESKRPICDSCKLPIYLVVADYDEHKVGHCRCPQNRIEKEQLQSEHETSTSTSDHRLVQSDHEMSNSATDHRLIHSEHETSTSLSDQRIQSEHETSTSASDHRPIQFDLEVSPKSDDRPIQFELQVSPASDQCPIQSEYETSTSTSDHRQVSADRLVRKTLSRKTRSQQSSWQAKKVKDQSQNSPEESTSNITTMAGAVGTLLTDTSCPRFSGNNRSYSASASFMINTDDNNNNPDLSSLHRTEETLMSNISLLANTSGISGQCTPEPSSFQTSDFKGAVPPFPRLLDTSQSPSAFGRQQNPSPSFNLNQEMPQPVLPEQAAVASTEKMEKWFGTIQDVLNTSGELPDAETAAALDKLDKEEQPIEEDSNEFPNYDSIPDPSESLKHKDDSEQHTDTDRSTSVSQCRIESDNIESESD